jgi:hypothetical protein
MQFRLHFVLLLFCLTTSLALAQGTPNSLGLAGTVRDTSGAVIVGAKVAVTTQDGKIVTQGVTDSSGNFRFRISAPATTRLT